MRFLPFLRRTCYPHGWNNSSFNEMSKYWHQTFMKTGCFSPLSLVFCCLASFILSYFELNDFVNLFRVVWTDFMPELHSMHVRLKALTKVFGTFEPFRIIKGLWSLPESLDQWYGLGQKNLHNVVSFGIPMSSNEFDHIWENRYHCLTFCISTNLM